MKLSKVCIKVNSELRKLQNRNRSDNVRTITILELATHFIFVDVQSDFDTFTNDAVLASDERLQDFFGTLCSQSAQSFSAFVTDLQKFASLAFSTW